MQVISDRFDLAAFQASRKFLAILAIALAVVIVGFGGSYWTDGGGVHESIEWIGVGLMVVCVLGRTWCSLYIGGHKSDACRPSPIVRHGPYSISRNPLYFFSVIGAAGVGAQFGSVALAVIAGLIAWLLFLLIVLREEQVLAIVHGQPYRDYIARVPRFLPKPTLWRDLDRIVVTPPFVLRTLADASVFFLAIPIAEGFEHLHDIGIIPTFFKLV